jgi:NAD(P)H-nitrite reductase large subunit
VDGKIKLKSGPQIERFAEHAIRFDDGSELEADVVVFATGCAASLHPFSST